MHQLLGLILKRLGFGAITLLVISVIVFSAVEFLPGDLAQQVLGQSATEETVAAFRRELGLDQPSVTRYFIWLADVAHGDFGNSLANGQAVSGLIAQRFANTLFLAGYAAAIAVPIALILGVLAALTRRSLFDRLINILSLGAISMPEFFIAYIMVTLFALKFGWFSPLANVTPEMPLGTRLWATLLPALTLNLVVVAHMMRMTRASILSPMASPYIEMADLKGITPLRVVIRHALPNALAPIINVVALTLAYLVVGVVIVEVVFVYPGLGQLMVDSVAKRDMTVVQACCLIFALTYILLNLTADILAIATNPRLLHPK
ncbi:ABC transporter permease [Defluviimonas salinarum]|uniref:ABC transporter permease n=1 Tax=Defluviimonas salinarum TaxID=2992147 RepID=A0ABT3J369_9RHOB|nr:ABC transporter permease [Defluviimonas salinarum]MCW3782103.1 ABC transporter permease [Defluviimonas salinarum]